ncbi:acyl-CoA thioesterase [Paracoccus liaowanqingii]|uniref:Acyl-CoA thioesterase n=1 Tax=Paracoccus liaowanqingii TaxID=2560053 RepID=A0A4Z1CAX7_9RHOB|nr:thioesterase family protein [Paracoccus liaowanqingii]TGN61600.1 acyl-CoA thioesterase [Paracoccus liaowanqingii]
MVISPIPTFSHPITISSEEIDAMGHVNNAVYLNWVQEAVVSYWRRNSPAEAQSAFLWVALKHEITYGVPLFLGDDVEALVTATGARGSRASFMTEFKRGKQLVADVRSTWGCVDAVTRRPRRISDDIAASFF